MGFGVARSDTKTQENLLKSGRSREELDKAISSVHRWDTQRERLRGAVYMNLLRAGYIQATDLTNEYRKSGKLDDAKAKIRQEIRDAGWHAAEDSRIVTILIDSLSFLLIGQGLWDQAEELEVQALETRKRVLGSEHPDTLTSVNNLALILRAQGKYVEAEKLNRRVLEERKRVMGELHPDTLTSVRNLALVLQDQEKYDEAEKMYQRALEGREKQLGKEHPDTLHSIHCLALLLHQLKRYEMASELYQRACDGFRKTLGPDHPKTVACLNNYSAMQIEKSPLKSVADEQVNSAPTDSGYASMAHGKSVPVFDTSQIGIDVIAKGLSLPDTNPAVEFEHSIDQEQVIPKFGLYTAPTTYSASETSTLPLPRDEKYISQLALDLFSSVKSYESDRTTLERISGKLPDLLRAFALKIGHKAQNPMHQDVSFFVHKHRR